MTCRFSLSLMLAAALALTSLPGAPAQAGNGDVAKWIAGGVALGLVGAVVAQSRHKDRRPAYHAPATPHHRYQDRRYRDPHARSRHYQSRHYQQPRSSQRRHDPHRARQAQRR